jgi:ATP-dependent 26S proteasome regulatory subunit
MQELDRFNGVVIVTTNLFGNYDPALLRRISRHIKFRLPDKAMRRRLFELHLPNRERVFADLNILATEAKGLSGGDILNVCLNAIYAGSTADDAGEWKVTGTDLLAEVTKVKAAHSDHRTPFCRETTQSA